MNICRAITLYNNFVPPSASVQTWEYEALGYYDGIDIGENIIADEESISLKRLWENLEEKARQLCGKYNAQTLFIFRTEDEVATIKDEEFWKKEECIEGKIFPFLFVMMVRLNLPAGEIKELRRNFETDTNGTDLKVITYLSLDNNDMIVAIKSRKYEDAAKLIDQFHQKISENEEEIRSVIYDSFSVGGIKKECVNSPYFFNADNSSQIEKICIRAIERAPGTLQDMKKKMREYFIIQEKVDSYPVLGCEDEVFLLENVPAFKFWRLYQDNKGMLSNSNKETYQKSVLGMTTLILQSRREETNQALFAKRGGGEKKVKKMCEDLRKELVSISQSCQIREKMYLKAMLQFINSLQKYEDMDYVDYTYVILYFPMKMLIELIREATEKRDEEIEGQADLLNGISAFFYALNLLTQNSIRLERQFFQNGDLNARIYEAPIQLNAFYSAYFSLLRDILNESVAGGYKYEFILCPGMAEYLKVQRILPHASRKNRLLLVEIPEHQIYDVRNQLMVMAHEAAHFVGRDIRCREERFEWMLEAIVKSVSTILVLDHEMHPFCTEDSVKKFEEDYLKALNEEIENYYTAIENSNLRKQEDKYHTEYMRKELWICAQSVLIGKTELLDGIGRSFLNECGRRMDSLNLDPTEKLREYRKFHTEFEECKTSFLIRATVPEIDLSDECCINNIVDSNIHFMKEAFADIMSILLLQLSPEEYIEILFGCSEQMGEIQGHIRTVEWRIALVIKTMSDYGNGNTNMWEADQLIQAANKLTNKPQMNLMNRVAGLLKDYLSGAKNIFELYEEDEQQKEEERLFFERRGINRLYNQDVSNIFIGYLGHCCKKFYNKEKMGIYKNEELGKLRDIWNKLKKVGSIEDYIINIRKFIEDYEEQWIVEKSS